MEFDSLGSFQIKYSSFQKMHSLITIFFLALLVIQAVLYFVTPLAEVFPGYQTLLVLGVEILIYIIISKIHELSAPLKCPDCHKILAYKYGLAVLNNLQCPHCKSHIFKNHMQDIGVDSEFV
jgi:hypothetical protein